MKEINSIILGYVEKQYNTQVALLRDIHVRIANILVITGLLLTLAIYLTGFIYRIKGIIPLLIILVPFGYGSLELIKTLFFSIKLSRLTGYGLPSLEKNVQQALVELQKKGSINENDTIQDLTKNYLTAFNRNLTIATKRDKNYTSLLTHLERGIIFLLLSIVLLFSNRVVQNHLLSSEKKEGTIMTENIDPKEQKTSAKTGEEEETPSPQETKPETTKPQQPSAQGEPTFITAAEEPSDTKTVEIDKKTLELKEKTNEKK